MTEVTERPSSAIQVATDKPKPAGQPVDTLELPLPPVTLDFAIRGEGRSESYLQRYVRKGDTKDATAAVTGKGGFGTAYRFIRDDSFSPPNSLLDATINSADHDCSHLSDQYLRGSEHQRITDLKRTVSHKSLSRQSVLSYNVQHKSLQPTSVPPSPPRASVVLQGRQHPGARSLAPAVVVVKVCRTPTSGSYDELPKTGIGRNEAKIAAQELANGNPLGEHTRIVRGEARLLRYLQICCSLEGLKSSQSHIVRLLADTPMPKVEIQGGRSDDGVDENSDQYNGPPVPRLLVFERLVDLDAELTPRGWAKDKGVWTIEKVETIARDAAAGIRFLHYHAIVHGDLKPSNFMRDARTGVVKLIDLGASRRWVRLHNMAKERTTAVEELDKAMQNGQLLPQRSEDLLCEGLGSLTGSPHFMAPEVLLQAGRYLSADGFARNVLDDYAANPSRLPRHPSVSFLNTARRDFKRGWGIKADIWSWGCSVLSLLLRTMDSTKRPSSNTVCAFDFSFEVDADALKPLWPLHKSNDSLPRFHQWARLYALRIMNVVEQGVVLPEYTLSLSSPYLRMVQESFAHQDTRPSAQRILDYIDSHSTSNVEYMSDIELGIGERAASRCDSTTPSCMSVSTVALSLPDDPHNIDLSVSSVAVTQSANVDTRLHGSDNNLAVPIPDTPVSRSQVPMLPKRDPKRQSTPRLLHGGTGEHPPQAIVQSHRITVNRSPSIGHRRTNSNTAGQQAGHGSHGSSIISDFRDPIMDSHTSLSQHASPATAHTTPALDERTRSRSALGRELATQNRIQEERVPNTRSSHTSNNLREQYLTAESTPSHRGHESQLRTSKSRRGSIFSRVASSLAPKLYPRGSSTNMQGNYVGGEQLSRAGLRNGEDSLAQAWNEASSPGIPAQHDTSSPQMEYLSGPATSNDATSLHEGALNAQESKNCKQRNSTHNMLGLEFGRAMQAPLRTVRSFASLRSINLTSTSTGDIQRSPSAQYAADHKLFSNIGLGTSPTTTSRKISNVARNGQEWSPEQCHGEIQSMHALHDSVHPSPASASMPTNEVLSQSSRYGSVGPQKTHAFLQFDPYSTDRAQPTPTTNNQAPTRQRSWSSLLFRRGKSKT